jgi:hypothetical protein
MIIPLRQSLTRTLFAPGALLALGLIAAHAQEAGAPAAPPTSSDVIETIVSIVYGLSANDLLNVRATASPIGLVLARIPNGTIVTRLECSTSRNAEWCRIEVPELDGLVGWAPARYLLSPRDDEAEAEAPAALPGPSVIDPSKITVGILPDPLPMPEDLLADAAPATTGGEPDLQTALLAPAPDGPSSFDAAREAEKIDGSAAELALAFATRTNPGSSEVYSAFDAEAAPVAEGAEAPAEAALAVPVPSPRPPRADEQEPGAAPAATVAALPSPDTAATQAADAAPARQDAPMAIEPEAPEATAPQAPPPALDPGSSPSAAQETSPAVEPPAAPKTVTVAEQEPAVALALPSDVPDDLAPASPAVPEPEDASTTPGAAAPGSSEPATGPDETGEAPRTLREQLAALLPSWSRPPAGTAAEPAPERSPDAAAQAESPEATTAAVAVPSEGDPEPAPSRAVGPAATIAGPAESPAAAATAGAVPSEGDAGPASARSEDGTGAVAIPDLPAAVGTASGTAPTEGDASPVPAASERAVGAADAAQAAAETARPPTTVAPPPAAVPAPVAPEPLSEPRPVETVAQAQPVEPTQPAPPPAEGETAEIPCARYVGQPMARCAVRILRLAANDADVTVLWPDGGERLIRFRGGQPDGTNTRGDFRFTREAELNLIRIGSGERFEILDALPFAE